MTFRAQDLSQTRSAVDTIFEALREAIVKGDLEQGAQLRQEQIAAAFNVSRIPVREAIARLEQLGLVETQRYRGAFVTQLNIADIEEVFRLRALIEAEAIRHAVPRLDSVSLTRARKAATAFHDATDPADWMDRNREFHAVLYRPDLQPRTNAILTNLLNLSDRFLRAQLYLTAGQARADREHRQILAACEAGDADLAADLTAQHIRDAMASLLAHLTEQQAPAV